MSDGEGQAGDLKAESVPMARQSKDALDLNTTGTAVSFRLPKCGKRSGAPSGASVLLKTKPNGRFGGSISKSHFQLAVTIRTTRSVIVNAREWRERNAFLFSAFPADKFLAIRIERIVNRQLVLEQLVIVLV